MKKLRKIVVLLLAIALGVSMPIEGSVVTATSTKEKIQQTEKEKDALEDKLGQTQDNLNNLKGERNTLKAELDTLNSRLTKVSENLAELEQQIDAKEEEITQIQGVLADAKEMEAWQYECMVIRVRDMYERKETSYLNAILNRGSFSDMLNAADIYEQIAEYDQKKLQEFKDNRKQIEGQEALLSYQKNELDKLKATEREEKNKVASLINQTSEAVEAYADQIEDAEAEALAYEAKIKAADNDLIKLRQKLLEEMALSRDAAGGIWRDISEVEFSEGDLYLLANLIYCEAGGEPYEGQLAVGSVVMNRVLSEKFPNTIVGVIYQNKQFSPVASGRLDLALAADKATEGCYRAAEEAMSGVTNVGKCLFFRTPIEGLEGINIGGHVFY